MIAMPSPLLTSSSAAGYSRPFSRIGCPLVSRKAGRQDGPEDERGGEGEVEGPGPALEVKVAGEQPGRGGAAHEQEREAREDEEHAEDEEELDDLVHRAHSKSAACPGAAAGGCLSRCW